MGACDSGNNSTSSNSNPPKDTALSTPIAVVESPVFSPAAGTYSAAQLVTISSGTNGATIYYTIDGSTPTTSSTLYKSSVAVSATKVLKAIAVKSDMTTSSVGVAEYTINTPDTARIPVFSPNGGAYSDPQLVSISSSTDGAVIYYTTDGKIPSTSSAKYTSPITVSSAQTLKAIAVKSGLTASPVGSAMFTYYGRLEYAGEIYKTVTIETQTWMAENLRYKIDSSWWYKESADSGAKYGLLYSWSGAMNLHDSCDWVSCGNQVKATHQGICPSGWHIPSLDDWRILEKALGSPNEAQEKLKSTENWWDGQNGTNSVGFNAQPGGERAGVGSFFYVNDIAKFWSTKEYSFGSSWFFCLYAESSTDLRGTYNKNNGYSIRCLKDTP